MKQGAKRVAGPLGLGAAACAACCAGPILGVIGGLSLAGSAVAHSVGAILFAVLLAVTSITVLVVHRRGRQQATSCATGISVEEPVATPVLRTRTPVR